MVPGQKPSSLRAHPPAPAFQVFSFQVFSIPELGQTANCLCSLRNYKCCQPPETGHTPAFHPLPPKAPNAPQTVLMYLMYDMRPLRPGVFKVGFKKFTLPNGMNINL